MGKDFLKIAKLAVFHLDCFASETTAKCPEIELKQVSPVQVLRERDGRVNYQFLSEINAPSRAALENYLKTVGRFKDMRQLRILSKREKDALALFRVNAKSSSAETVIKKGGMYLKPVSMSQGYEVHTVVSTKPTGIAKLLEELDEIGEVKVLHIGKENENEKQILTDKQLKALELAMAHGYYEWPRNITLFELAKLVGLSRRAFQESLRKAESKVFPKHIKELITSQN